MATAANKRGRKKAAPVVEVEAPVEVIPPPPRANKVSLSDLWDMRLAQLEKRALLAEAEVSRMTKLYALEKLDKKGIVLSLEKKMSAAQRLADAADTKAKLAKQRMETTIGRKLSNVSIDPDTGEIVNTEE
jgi:hypothetical protein